jgi:hypothetical protein
MTVQGGQEAPLATFEFSRGALAGSHLSLFATRLVHRGEDFSETVALERISAVRIAFEREGGRISLGGVLLVVALGVFVASWPLRMLVTSLLGEVVAQPQGGAFLPAALRALDLGVAVLPFASVAVALWAVAWMSLGWVGETVLTLLIPPGERAYAVRGRDPALQEFAESLASRIAGGRRT